MDIEVILALLKTKFSSEREDVLRNVAGVIALQADNKEAAETIINAMTSEKVAKFGQSYRSSIDKEINASNKTLEKNLRDKFNFVEKDKKVEPTEPPKDGAITLDILKAVMAEQLKSINDRMDAYDNAKIGATRRETYLGKLKDAKISEDMQNMMMSQFDRMTFADDADFNKFLADSQPNIDKMAQSESDRSLGNDRVPRFGSSSSADKSGEMSQGMKDYLAAKQKSESESMGKALI